MLCYFLRDGHIAGVEMLPLGLSDVKVVRPRGKLPIPSEATDLEITIDWQKPVQLTFNKKMIIDPDALPPEIETYPGVYFFARWFGETSVPFYIGQSLNIRARLKQHINTVKIYKALLGINDGKLELAGGPRFFHFGYLKAKPGQQAATCIKIVEKRMLREAVIKGLTILNAQGIKIRTHEILFDGPSDRLSIFDRRAEVEAR